MYKKTLFIFTLLLSFSNANAWDNIVTGEISSFEAHAPASSNRNITLALKDVATLCSLPSNNITAYIKKSDLPDTFDVFVSTLLAAKVSGQSVKLYINLGNEGCRIDRVDLL